MYQSSAQTDLTDRNSYALIRMALKSKTPEEIAEVTGSDVEVLRKGMKLFEEGSEDEEDE